jgi:hypothetical protein
MPALSLVAPSSAWSNLHVLSWTLFCNTDNISANYNPLCYIDTCFDIVYQSILYPSLMY